MLAGREDAHPVIFLSGYGDVPDHGAGDAGRCDRFPHQARADGHLLAAIDARARARPRAPGARRARADLRARYASLTPREREVMAGVVAGRLNKQICHALDAAERPSRPTARA
jgi:FixJ family two-component response regulator